MIDLQLLAKDISKSLPTSTRWDLGTMHCDFNFGSEYRSLAPVNEADFFLADMPMPKEWQKLRKFGDLDYCDGGGANPILTVHEDNGIVYGLDIDLPGNEMQFYNSSIDQFISTFNLINRYLSTSPKMPKDILSQIERIDPTSFSDSEWKSMIEYAIDSSR